MTLSDLAGEAKLTPIAALHPNPDNPRTITEERFSQLVAAIRSEPDMLWARPLVARPDGTVIAGNMRLRAALELGYTHLPVLYVDRDDTSLALWALRDNNEYGSWDDQLLAEQLYHLSVAEADLDLAGFDDAELQRLLDSVSGLDNPGAGDPDDVPGLPVEAETQPGDLIELGSHRLYCGDATLPESYERLLAGDKVDVILTDPPYGIDLDTDYSNLGSGTLKGSKKSILGGKPGRTYRPVIGDDKPFDAAPILALAGDVKEQFWFGGDYYRRTLSSSDLDGSYLVWDKRNENSDKGYGSGFELIWSKQPHKRDLLRHYYFGTFGPDTRNREHPTQKPVNLIEEIIERWSKPGMVILDPFAGSGTTLIAAERLGRVARVMEIDPRYCDVVRQRYADYTAA